MSRINLLPWREQKRQEQQREFSIIAGFAAVLACIGVFYAYTHVNGLIEYQQNRNTFLQNEIRLLDRQIAEIKELQATRDALVARINIIQQLQSSRPVIVHLFDELVTTLPNGMHLTSVVQRGNSLEINGRAESNARISAFMRNLEDSPWFNEPVLQVIEVQVQNNQRLSHFRLTVQQRNPS